MRGQRCAGHWARQCQPPASYSIACVCWSPQQAQEKISWVQIASKFSKHFHRWQQHYRQMGDDSESSAGAACQGIATLPPHPSSFLTHLDTRNGHFANVPIVTLKNTQIYADLCVYSTHTQTYRFFLKRDRLLQISLSCVLLWVSTVWPGPLSGMLWLL